MKPAVFLDRDGTINIDYNYVHEIDRFDFVEGAIKAMKKLKEMGFLLVIVTNQSGIARNKFTQAQFDVLTEWMDWSLQEQGVFLDGIFYCPHDPNIEQCDCRKPNPGMILEAAKELDIDLKHSYMVGDKDSDLMAGRNAGVGTTVFVESGHAITEAARRHADWILKSLAELPAQIEKQKNLK